MSQETDEWLNRFCLIGMTDKRGRAWHYRESAQGDEPNHYPGFIPVPDVLRRLFSWEAVEAPVFLNIGGEFRQIGDRKAITRSDDPMTVLGIFKEGYVPHSYSKWLLEIVAEILGTELGISSAGLLQKGGLAWVEVSVPENIMTPEGVEFRSNLLAGTSFNGVLSTTYKRTNSVTVCDNTMMASLASDGEELKIKHTKYSGLRIDDARDALSLIVESQAKFANDITTLCNVKVSDKEFSQILDLLAPVPENSARGAGFAATKRDTLSQLYKSDSRVAPWNGTAFGVLQADNTYRHHYAIVRGTDGGHAERNAENALLGKTGEADSKILAAIAKVKNMPELIAA
jgi:phage/plasmid-like protein (TIGR03299 family)